MFIGLVTDPPRLPPHKTFCEGCVVFELVHLWHWSNASIRKEKNDKNSESTKPFHLHLCIMAKVSKRLGDFVTVRLPYRQQSIWISQCEYIQFHMSQSIPLSLSFVVVIIVVIVVYASQFYSISLLYNEAYGKICCAASQLIFHSKRLEQKKTLQTINIFPHKFPLYLNLQHTRRKKKRGNGIHPAIFAYISADKRAWIMNIFHLNSDMRDVPTACMPILLNHKPNFFFPLKFACQ